MEALTVKKRLELRLLTLWYLLLKNLWVGKVQVLAAAITACNAQAILENFYRYKTIYISSESTLWELKKMKSWSEFVLFCWKSLWFSFLGLEWWWSLRVGTEREIERFLFFQLFFFCGGFWVGYLWTLIFFMYSLGWTWTVSLFHRLWKKVGFCKVVFFLSGCHEAKLIENLHLRTKDLEWNLLYKNKVEDLIRVFLRGFGLYFVY